MRKIILICLIVGLAVVGVYMFNYFTLIKTVSKITQADTRNAGVEYSVHYKNYISTTNLVFNIDDVREDKAITDVFRLFLQVSSSLKDKDFETVELAFRNKVKFRLSGVYFNNLGKEFESQNPVYTMRTFPENVLNVNGQSAYGKWSGGMFGVLKKQMEDFNDFNKKWYLEDLSEGQL